MVCIIYHGILNSIYFVIKESVNVLQFNKKILGKASPVMIPQRTNSQIHIRPMRSSVEGLNQEIEKLVLYTGQAHSCRNESGLVSLKLIINKKILKFNS